MKGHLHFDITELDENTSRLTTDCHLEEVSSTDVGRLVCDFMKVLNLDPIDLYVHACSAQVMENELFCDRQTDEEAEPPEPPTDNHDNT